MPTSARELYVLGRIAREPAHGHEIMRIIRLSRANLWLEISEKHVYYVLRKLEREGLVRVSEEREGARPARKVYSITSSGRAALKGMLIAEDIARTVPYSAFDTVVVMLANTDVLSDDERTAVLKQRLRVLGERLRDLHPEGEGEEMESRFGGLARVLHDKSRSSMMAEITWLSGLVREVEERGWSWLAGPSPASASRSDPVVRARSK